MDEAPKARSNERKMTDAQREESIRRYQAGESIGALAACYGVATTTLSKFFKRRGVHLPPAELKATKSRDISEFTSRVHSVLWRQDGADKKTYNAWEARVKQLQEGAGYTQDQAVVRASKEFPCLTRLFREYDVSELDPNPDSHPQIQHFGQAPQSPVEIEGREQSYRENLRWAIEAAGEYLRTGQPPLLCPNNSAFYLYRQAIEEPKDFLGRVGQIESKGDGELEEQRLARKAGNRTIAEIDEMLASLEVSDGQ